MLAACVTNHGVARRAVRGVLTLGESVGPLPWARFGGYVCQREPSADGIGNLVSPRAVVVPKKSVDDDELGGRQVEVQLFGLNLDAVYVPVEGTLGPTRRKAETDHGARFLKRPHVPTAPT